MRYLILTICTLFLVSCGSAVVTDFDSSLDFTSYNTYNFYPDIQSGLNQLDDRRIIKAIDSLMSAKGWTKSETPQVFVNFFANEFLTESSSSIGFGVGSGGGNVGVGVSGGVPVGGTEVNQRFTIDLIDVEKDNLLWQGELDSRFKERATPQQRQAYYFRVISKILKKYPPKTKK